MRNFLISIFCLALAQVVTCSCPNVKSAVNFNPSASNGLWYVTHSTDDVDCTSFETISSNEPHSFNTIYYPYNLACTSKLKDANDATAGFIDNCEWNERFHNTNGQIFIVDYDHYLGYAVCLNENGKEFLYVSLSSRDKTMKEEYFETFKEFLSVNYGFDISTLKNIKHDNC